MSSCRWPPTRRSMPPRATRRRRLPSTARRWARSARRPPISACRWCIFPPTTCSPATSRRPYVETDPTGPLSAYGRTKLAGELALAAATPNHAILRTAWVYSPFGKNFVKTMLRLGETRDSVGVVADQVGNPTSALDIADGLLKVADNLIASSDPALRGTFHMTGRGETSMGRLCGGDLPPVGPSSAASRRHGRADPDQRLSDTGEDGRATRGSTAASWSGCTASAAGLASGSTETGRPAARSPD